MNKPIHLVVFVAINVFALLTAFLFVRLLGVILGDGELHVPLVVTFLAAAIIPEIVAVLTVSFSQPGAGEEEVDVATEINDQETSQRAWIMLIFVNTTASLSTLLTLFVEMADKGKIDVVSGFTAVLAQFFVERNSLFFCLHQAILSVAIVFASILIWLAAKMLARPHDAERVSAVMGAISYVLVLLVVLFCTPWETVAADDAFVSATGLFVILFVSVVAIAILLAIAVGLFSRTVRKILTATRNLSDGKVFGSIFIGLALGAVAWWLFQAVLGGVAATALDPTTPDGAAALERSNVRINLVWRDMWETIGWVSVVAVIPLVLFWTVRFIVWLVVKTIDILSAILSLSASKLWKFLLWLFQVAQNRKFLWIDWGRIFEWRGWQSVYQLRPQISARQLSLLILALTWINLIAIDSIAKHRPALNKPFSVLLDHLDEYFRTPVDVAATPFGTPTARYVRLCSDMAVAPSWSLESTTRLEFPVAGCELNESWVNSNGVLLIFGVASPEGNAQEELLRARTRALALAQNVQFQTGEALQIYVLNLGKARSSLSFAYGSQMFRPSLEERPILATLFEPTPADWNMSEEDVQNLIAQFSIDADFSNLFSGCELFEFDRKNRSLLEIDDFECK